MTISASNAVSPTASPVEELRVYADSLRWVSYGPWEYRIRREDIEKLYDHINAVVLAERAAGATPVAGETETAVACGQCVNDERTEG